MSVLVSGHQVFVSWVLRCINPVPISANFVTQDVDLKVLPADVFESLIPPPSSEVGPEDGDTQLTWFHTEGAHVAVAATTVTAQAVRVEIAVSGSFLCDTLCTPILQRRVEDTRPQEDLPLDFFQGVSLPPLVAESIVFLMSAPLNYHHWNRLRQWVNAPSSSLRYETAVRALGITALLISKVPKSPEGWTFRQWLLPILLETSSQPQPQCPVTFEQEMLLVETMCDRHPRNYPAWQYRAALLKSLSTKGSALSLYHKEAERVLTWLDSHWADASAAHHLVSTVLPFFLRPTGVSDKKSANLLLQRALQLSQHLIRRCAETSSGFHGTDAGRRGKGDGNTGGFAPLQKEGHADGPGGAENSWFLRRGLVHLFVSSGSRPKLANALLFHPDITSWTVADELELLDVFLDVEVALPGEDSDPDVVALQKISKNSIHAVRYGAWLCATLAEVSNEVPLTKLH